MPSTAPRTRWTLAIASLALFMVVLDNLIVTVALPSIREDLGASLEQLEWTVNAYTLAFAVALIPGAAIGDRFGRRRTFIGALALFTASSAAAALAPGSGELIAARALQGIAGAAVAPLTLTLLADAFPPERRGAALGIWSGVSGMGIALGPLVGGAVVAGLSWQWIFWINVPLGLALLPLAATLLRESHGAQTRLDAPGIGLVGVGLLAVVFGLVRAPAEGWTSPLVVASMVGGIGVLAVFVAWERRVAQPMMPLDLFARRTFAVTNAVSFFMYFGTFGAIFLLTQYTQLVMGFEPFDAGVRMLVWTGATAVTAPLAGVLSERYGPRPFMAGGLALLAGALAWIAAGAGPSTQFAALVIPFAMAGVGMALVFAPSASALLSVVSPERAGQASGTNNAIREVGGVFGVAVLSSVFAHSGGFGSAQAFVDGFGPAVWLGAGVVAAGAVSALLLPARRPAPVGAAGAEPAPVAA